MRTRTIKEVIAVIHDQPTHENEGDKWTVVDLAELEAWEANHWKALNLIASVLGAELVSFSWAEVAEEFLKENNYQEEE